MKKITVLHISRGFEDYVISLANEIGEYVDFHMIITESDRWIEPHLSKKIKIYYSEAPRVSDIRNIRSVLRICHYVKRLKPDIIHMQNGVIWEALLPLFFKRIKFITTIHDVTIHPNRGKSRFTPQIILDALTQLSDGLIIHGERLREAALSRHGKKREKYLEVINHPIISRYGISRPETLNRNHILFFGTLDEWKGIEYLLSAMEVVTSKIPNVILKISGGSPTPDYYKNLNYKHENIQWDIRRQSEADVKNLFEWADILVLPYIEASQSGVLHIAQSFGTPVIATRTGALQDSVIDEETGLIVAPRSTEELASAILRLLTNSELRKRMTDNLIAYRDDCLCNKTVGKNTAIFYKKVLEQ